MIKYASKDDLDILEKHDKHISKSELINQINLKRIIIIEDNKKFIGWLRFNLFWDNTPFLNMLYLLEENRGKGYGRELIEFWENEMKKQGYDAVMTSTLSNEQAQFFYRKLGYMDKGALLLPNEPLEIIFYKKLNI